MVTNNELSRYTNELLAIKQFDDYAPNGLQIEGKQQIKKIVSGVSANMPFIEAAIAAKADAVFIHHGFFWRNEAAQITGAKRQRIAALLEHNINLFAYHLPLDDHETLGNNAQLAQRLHIENAQKTEIPLLWQGKIKPVSAEAFTEFVSQKLARQATYFGASDKKIERIAWCTGGAQGLLDEAIELGVDAYLSGEISEKTPYQAIDNNMVYIWAGHHATERYGIQALCRHLSHKFQLEHRFIEIKNAV